MRSSTRLPLTTGSSSWSYSFHFNRLAVRRCTGPGVPLGTRTAPTGCFAGLFSAKRDARGYSWSSFPSGSDNARYWHFNYNFLARQASKTPRGRGFQLRCLQEHP